MIRPLVALFSLGFMLSTPAAHVVINEIMYHPPNDRDNLQYIELFNPTSAPVDLSGWKLTGGIKFSFPRCALAPGGFLVVARDTNAFQAAHQAATGPLGNFTGKLSHKGEKVELVDPSGQVVEKVHYRDQAPWPLGPDGYGSSLERICNDAPAEDPGNWLASSSSSRYGGGGTPGATNSVASASPLPSIEKVQWQQLTKPNQSLEVTAEITGKAVIESVALQYWTLRSARETPPVDLEMQKAPGSSGAVYKAQIPPQPAGTLVRFTIQAKDKNQAVRVAPGTAEPRPAFSSLFTDPLQPARIPLITVMNPEPLRGGGNKFGAPRRDANGPGKSAVLYVPPTGEPHLFDFVQVRRRAGGLKIHFFRDQPLEEMTGINLLFEGPPRWVLAEHLSYELYRKAGLKTEKSGHARLTVDGRALGYYLFVEQPNKHFLARSGRDETGNLYKVLWFGNGIINQHEKKTNPETGHDDIVSLIQTLRKKTGAAQWAYINEQMDVDAFVNYYAVNMCIQNWDGFFNNHFVYHDLKPGGKWEIIPWDEDKTWGEYDGGPRDYSWYDMPLTMGMNGDRQRGGGSSWFGGGGGFDGYWRPPGFLSGPLLANPQFRQKFEARLRELCTTVFTPEQFGPIVRDLQERLRGEVEIKARAMNQDPAWALKQFDAEMASFHRQLVNRRKFILANLK